MTVRTYIIAVFAALAMALGVAAVASAQPTSSAPTPPAGSTTNAPQVVGGVLESGSAAYILGRDDVVEVGLLGRNDFGGRTRVQADGTIQLAFIGKIPAADRTTAELAETIAKSLKAGGYFADPVVTIEVVGYASRYVTVLGSVGSPGLVPINRPYRLSEILARVGGVRDGAADYIVVRPAQGDERRLSIRDLATGDITKDPYVQPGDKIYAPVAETFYIYGKVNAPGSYQISADMTVRQAIGRAGGLAEQGSDKKVDVNRGGKKVRVLLDDKVQPGDVLVVGEKMF